MRHGIERVQNRISGLEKWLPEMNPEDRSRTEALIRHLKMTRNGLINEASETLRGRDYCHADSR